jgi:hypothetical protein
VAGNGGGTDVEPVLVVRSELLAGSGLDEVDPDGDLELTREAKEEKAPSVQTVLYSALVRDMLSLR